MTACDNIQKIAAGDGVKSKINHFGLFTWKLLRVLRICFALIQHQCKMTQYNNVNVKLFNSHFKKLNSETKNGFKVTLNLSSDMISGSNDMANFSHNILLFDRQFSRLCKAFARNSTVNIKLSKSPISEIVQSGGLEHWTY